MFSKIRVEIDPLASENNCYNNCVAKVERDKGEVEVGWRKTPAVEGGLPFFSRDHHAVWKSLSGELVDISPRVAVTHDKAIIIRDGEIDFLPDPDATFLDDGKARASTYFFEGEDRWGLLQQACDWANRSAGFIASGEPDKADYADGKAKAYLTQHANRLRRT